MIAITTILLVLIIFVFISIMKPTWLVILYILASTKFLGYFDFGLILYNNLDVLFPLINISIVLISLAAARSCLIARQVFPLALTLVMLFSWGFIAPYVLDFQSLLQSAIAAKEFYYFSILIYLFVTKDRLDLLKILNFIKILGVYLAVVYLLHGLFGVSPPFYLTEVGQPNIWLGVERIYESSGPSVRVYYPTYISFALLVLYVEWLERIRSSLYLLVLGGVLYSGLLLSGYLALSTTTAVAILVLFVVYRGKPGFDITRTLIRIALVCLVFVTVLASSEVLRNGLFNKVRSVVGGTDMALTSRERYNEFRWDAIANRPIMGHGFVHKSSKVMREIRGNRAHRFTESLGVIDSGYIDLLTKFGYFGTFAYLSAIFAFLASCLVETSRISALRLSMVIFVAQYFIIGVTWSVFSFAHGIIPLSLAIFFAHSKNGLRPTSQSDRRESI